MSKEQTTLDKLITSPIRDKKASKMIELDHPDYRTKTSKMSQLELDSLAMAVGTLAKLCAELRTNGRTNDTLNEVCRTMVNVLIKEQEKT